MIIEIQPKIKFQNIVQCPFKEKYMLHKQYTNISLQQ